MMYICYDFIIGYDVYLNLNVIRFNNNMVESI
jgi:hypothetical protein